MGNTLGGKKTTKVMKMDGETFKLKTPVRAEEVIKNYPNHVLLESEAVKHYGTRAKPLEAHQNLQPKRLYFLVVLPEAPKEKIPRRVRSGINMSAKDRLESLMLARRSASDLTIMNSITNNNNNNNGAMRVKMRLPRAEVEMLMKDSKSDSEAAHRIVDLYMKNRGINNGGNVQFGHHQDGVLLQQQNSREKRVSFMPNGVSQIVVAS